ncbi:DUF6694 family lipoprotein [Methylomonas sp. MED-D]|uniref:Lipoprotein n=1 Tax=Methylomonas koyamae TaxID=702114 RepID=A0A177N108_9GAMM|nr:MULTISPECIES: DUF6694 family lipoprotein [Methylomonas]NJA06417.1 hypothetical protein [Methylococcaceae bacterium WWC4]MDT4328411.1 hypothetical protein [Methylomonas sp. MV1]OAI11648.1 hypothetical protein A1355_15560 [Methylomonas koyamae]OHX37296.1 hypothetical protein BJL95_21795 [Methylomonas sp. LWB]WGS88290.1 hypothetical protein QC632_11140 [Methylomonas sp. UP202]
MKIASILFVLLLGAVASGCNKSNQINGSSMKTVNRSISHIKEKLPLDQRIEFEVSFWTLRDEIRDNGEFLNEIDGKTPEQLIEKGKELFAKRKAAGSKDYEEYANWDQMIAQYSQERIDQNRKKAPDPRDKQYPHRVDYKMHSM